MIEGTAAELKRLEEEAKGESTGSSNSSSSDSSSNWDIDLGPIGDKDEGAEVEDNEKVNQVGDPAPILVPVPAPIPALAPPAIVLAIKLVLVPSSDSDAIDEVDVE